MDAGLTLQYVVIALAVGLSAVHVVRSQWPGAVRRLRGWIAIRLLDGGRGPLLRRIGRAVAPPPRTGEVGCGGCNGCEPAARR